jgi:glycosyltransferase involved in cell wall biosynthesis
VLSQAPGQQPVLFRTGETSGNPLMKILYHHRTQASDGQYVHISELTHALAQLGHEVVMVGPGEDKSRRKDAGNGDGRGLRDRLPAWLYELLELGYSLVALAKLWRAYRRHRPDGLYERYNLLCPAGVWLRKLTGLPMALEVNAPLYEERSDHGDLALKRLARWSERVAWQGADLCLPVTGVLAQQVRDAGVLASKIHVIPNGVGEPFLDGSATPNVIIQRFGLQGALILGFTGFVRPWHGMDRVLDLLASGRLPVIATDVGDVKHMLAPKFAEDCVAPKADAGAYAAMLRRMVENKMARTAVGSANQTYARAHFGIDRMLETYDRLFQARITGRATA